MATEKETPYNGPPLVTACLFCDDDATHKVDLCRDCVAGKCGSCQACQEQHGELIKDQEEEIADLRAKLAAAEPLQAAALWSRLVTIWESDDGPTKAGDPEILDRVAELINEWHGFADKPEGT